MLQEKDDFSYFVNSGGISDSDCLFLSVSLMSNNTILRGHRYNLQPLRLWSMLGKESQFLQTNLNRFAAWQISLAYPEPPFLSEWSSWGFWNGTCCVLYRMGGLAHG